MAIFPGVTVRTWRPTEGIPARPGVVTETRLDGLTSLLVVHYGDQTVTAPECLFERLRAPLVPAEARAVLDARATR